jgi:hypothetical protein
MFDLQYRKRPTPESVCSWDGYLYFVYERNVMKIVRDHGCKTALTADPILLKYRFTNIRRRDDRMSQWFIKNLIKPFVNHDNLWFTLLVARLINWPPTLQALLDAGVLPCIPGEFNPARFVEVIEGLKAPGVKVFGSAYTVYPTNLEVGVPKSYAVAKHTIGDVIKNAPMIHSVMWDYINGNSIEEFVGALSQCFGISTFIAGQVAADLTYDDAHLGSADDLYLFAPLGPGSQAGLNFLYGHKPNHKWKQSDFNEALIFADSKVKYTLGIMDLTLHDVQNTMCEYSKYVKAVTGLINPRKIYQTETGY